MPRVGNGLQQFQNGQSSAVDVMKSSDIDGPDGGTFFIHRIQQLTACGLFLIQHPA
jgi:hypothetical protein